MSDDIKRKDLGPLLAGSLGSILGMLGGNFYVNNKMLTFDQTVADLTRKDIMERAAAGLSNIGVGADASGIGSHVIQEAHTLKLINSGEHGFAKFIWNVGGKGNFALGCTLAVGATAAGLYYMIVPRKKDEEVSDRMLPQGRLVMSEQTGRAMNIETNQNPSRTDWQSRTQKSGEEAQPNLRA